jgi:hypothetical protein
LSVPWIRLFGNLTISQAFDIDFVSAITFADSFNSPASSANPRGTAKTPIIAGALSGACIAIAWMVAIVWFCLRRRKLSARIGHILVEESSTNPFNTPSNPAMINEVAPVTRPDSSDYTVYTDNNDNDTIHMGVIRRRGANNENLQFNQEMHHSNQQIERFGEPETRPNPKAPTSTTWSDITLPIAPKRLQELAASRARISDRPR